MKVEIFGCDSQKPLIELKKDGEVNIYAGKGGFEVRQNGTLGYGGNWLINVLNVVEPPAETTVYFNRHTLGVMEIRKGEKEIIAPEIMLNSGERLEFFMKDDVEVRGSIVVKD